MAHSDKKLSPAQEKLMKNGGVEPPYFGRFWNHDETGIYACASCGTPLFSSKEKFDAKNGWPSFREPFNVGDLEFKKAGADASKVPFRCKKCHSYLGYLLNGKEPYYQLNSVALAFEELKDLDLELPDDDSKDDSKKQDVPNQTIVYVVVGVAAGAVLGAGAGFLYSQENCSPSFFASSATSTPLIDLASSTPQKATSTPTKAPTSNEPAASAADITPEPTTPEPAIPVPGVDNPPTDNSIPGTAGGTLQ
jgi:peptide-methionine (R)-S-oxide reductase